MNVIETSIVILVIGILFFIAIKGLRKGLRYGLRLLLADYVLIILCSTVIFRKFNPEANYSYQLFRTYNLCNDGFLLLQGLMNILVFVPVGMLLKVSFSFWKWWQLLLMGCGLSSIIEISQLVLHRGFCEIDDVMHNGIGCLFGILLCCCCMKR